MKVKTEAELLAQKEAKKLRNQSYYQKTRIERLKKCKETYKHTPIDAYCDVCMKNLFQKSLKYHTTKSKQHLANLQKLAEQAEQQNEQINNE
jgi:hypothetical protein